ncbi:phage baseplate assembly protein V [Limimaricola cinnabarinus]|uniref:phage baseplate assembly protein V n=1 Tax=Limimaricola cinnabarinus TaxID=1125964 RepID=UPI002FE32E30
MSFQAAEAERRAAGIARSGRVVAVDAAQARAQVSFGGETQSAWLPFMAVRAGAAMVWAPPVVGELVWVLSESGDTAQGVILGSAFTGANPAPSTKAEAVEVHIGDARLVMEDGSLELSAGGVTLTISSAGVAVAGGKVSHDGTDIGKTHKHTHGSPTTSPPI